MTLMSFLDQEKDLDNMEKVEKKSDNNFVYDSVKAKKSKIKIHINKDTIKLDYDKIIDTFFTQGNISDDILKKQLVTFLNLGVYSKAPCGGFVNFFEVFSKKGDKYIIYSGIREVSNSYFIVEIHEIIKL